MAALQFVYKYLRVSAGVGQPETADGVGVNGFQAASGIRQPENNHAAGCLVCQSLFNCI